MTALPPLYVPEVIQLALAQGADCGISISGGKDSQALLTIFTRWHREQRFPGHLLALHADLGRAEWVETPAFVATLCAHLAIPLVVVRRTQGDLLDRLQERMQKLACASPCKLLQERMQKLAGTSTCNKKDGCLCQHSSAPE